MTLRKLASRTTLQVPLETLRDRFIGEPKTHLHCPRAVVGGVNVLAGVVPPMPLLHVRREARVSVNRVSLAAQEVDDALGFHAEDDCNPQTDWISREKRVKSIQPPRAIAIVCVTRPRRTSQE